MTLHAFIPTTIATQKLAESFKIPRITLDDMVKLGKTQLDVAIDGVDAVDPGLCLLKGGGGALLCEKMVGIVFKKVHMLCGRDQLVQRPTALLLPAVRDHEILPGTYNVCRDSVARARCLPESSAPHRRLLK